MNFNWRKGAADVTAMSNWKSILCDGHPAASASGVAEPVGNQSNMPPNLDAAVQKVASSMQRVEGEDMFEVLADSPVLEKRPA